MCSWLFTVMVVFWSVFAVVYHWTWFARDCPYKVWDRQWWERRRKARQMVAKKDQ